VAGALRLTNVRFEQVGVEDFDAPPGSFDYAIAHGIFSWLPAPARERLLALCAHLLSQRGIAYVSYNALPGAACASRCASCSRFSAKAGTIPRSGSRSVLALLSGDNEPATMLGAEAAELSRRSDALLFHDVLAEINEPYLFSEFVALAAEHGLQFLAEADLREMQTDVLPQDLRRGLLCDDDVLRREQVLRRCCAAPRRRSIARRARSASRRCGCRRQRRRTSPRSSGRAASRSRRRAERA
jgi:hypothetical protein